MTRSIPLFRIFYSTTFTLLSLVLLALLLITPSDAIRQSLRNDQLYNVFVIAGAYLLTAVVAVLIYASRLYNNRARLAAIPKEGLIGGMAVHVGDRVQRLMREGMSRSAEVRWASTPKDLSRAGDETSAMWDSKREYKHLRKSHRQEMAVLSVGLPSTVSTEKPSSTPPWGPVAHPGWSGPSTTDIPNVQYQTVIQELPHLIEAKAVSLAPRNSSAEPTTEGLPIAELDPDPQAVLLLQRAPSTGIREYIAHLTSLFMIHPPEVGELFLSAYEKARFSGSQIEEDGFRDLMKTFAELLRGMTSLSEELLAQLREAQREDDGSEEGSFTSSSRSTGSSASSVISRTSDRDEATRKTRGQSPSPSFSADSTTGSTSTQRIHPTPLRPRTSRSNTSFGVASSVAGTTHDPNSQSRMQTANDRPSTPPQSSPLPPISKTQSSPPRQSHPRRPSTFSHASSSQMSQSSVIRLARPEDGDGAGEGPSLPYIIMTGGGGAGF
ncbi:MAG: hypothetical protein M1817_003058 [Caeruleum heppii]|nr:MAG: hypothetical protein M1817_003058 [Caeruleum heppii]